MPLPASFQQTKSWSSSVPSEGHKGRLWSGLCGETKLGFLQAQASVCLKASVCLSISAAVGRGGHKWGNYCKLTTHPRAGVKEWNGRPHRALRTFLAAEDHPRDMSFPTSSSISQAEPTAIQALGHPWPSLLGRVLPGRWSSLGFLGHTREHLNPESAPQPSFLQG